MIKSLFIFCSLFLGLHTIVSAQDFLFEWSKGTENPDFVSISPSGKYLVTAKKGIGFKITDNDKPDFVRYLAHPQIPKRIQFNRDETILILNAPNALFEDSRIGFPVMFHIVKNEKKTLPFNAVLTPTPYADSILVHKDKNEFSIIDFETFSIGSSYTLQQEIDEVEVSGNGSKWALRLKNSILYGDFFSLNTLKSITMEDDLINIISFSFLGDYLSFSGFSKTILIELASGDAFSKQTPMPIGLQQFDDAHTNFIYLNDGQTLISKLYSWNENSYVQEIPLGINNHVSTKSRKLNVFIDTAKQAKWTNDSFDAGFNLIPFATICTSFNIAHNTLTTETATSYTIFNSTLNEPSIVNKQEYAIYKSVISPDNFVHFFIKPNNSDSLFGLTYSPKNGLKDQYYIYKVSDPNSWDKSESFNFFLESSLSAAVWVSQTKNEQNIFTSLAKKFDIKPSIIRASTSGSAFAVLDSQLTTLSIVQSKTSESKTFSINLSDLVGIQFAFNDSLLLLDFNQEATFFLEYATGKTFSLGNKYSQIQSFTSYSNEKNLFLTGDGELYLFFLDKNNEMSISDPLLRNPSLVTIKMTNKYVFMQQVNGQIDIAELSNPAKILGTLFTTRSEYLFIKPNGEYEGNKDLLNSVYITDSQGKRINKVNYRFKSGLMSPFLK